MNKDKTYDPNNTRQDQPNHHKINKKDNKSIRRRRAPEIKKNNVLDVLPVASDQPSAGRYPQLPIFALLETSLPQATYQ